MRNGLNGCVRAYVRVQVDEYLADKPELKKQAEEDTKNQIWHLPHF